MSAKTITAQDYKKLRLTVEKLASEVAALRATMKREKLIQHATNKAIAAEKRSDVNTLYKPKMTLRAMEKWRKQTREGMKRYGVMAVDFAASINVRPGSFLAYLYGGKYHPVPVEIGKRTREMFAILASKTKKASKK